MDKAVLALRSEGTVSNVRIFFKNRKRKKFIASANKDIKAFYDDYALEDTLNELQSDNEVLDSNKFVVSAADKLSQKYKKSPDELAKRYAAEFKIWEIYKEISCQKALYNAFPEDVFKESAIMEKYITLTKKVNNQLAKTRLRMSERGIAAEFTKLISEKNSEIDDYKVLIEVLK